MRERIPKEAPEEHIGMGEPLVELAAKIKKLGEEVVRLDDEAKSAVTMGERDRAASLQREKDELLKEQRELLQKCAELRAHELKQS